MLPCSLGLKHIASVLVPPTPTLLPCWLSFLSLALSPCICVSIPLTIPCPCLAHTLCFPFSVSLAHSPSPLGLLLRSWRLGPSLCGWQQGAG